MVEEGGRRTGKPTWFWTGLNRVRLRREGDLISQPGQSGFYGWRRRGEPGEQGKHVSRLPTAGPGMGVQVVAIQLSQAGTQGQTQGEEKEGKPRLGRERGVIQAPSSAGPKQ